MTKKKISVNKTQEQIIKDLKEQIKQLERSLSVKQDWLDRTNKMLDICEKNSEREKDRLLMIISDLQINIDKITRCFHFYELKNGFIVCTKCHEKFNAIKNKIDEQQ